MVTQSDRSIVCSGTNHLASVFRTQNHLSTVVWSNLLAAFTVYRLYDLRNANQAGAVSLSLFYPTYAGYAVGSAGVYVYFSSDAKVFRDASICVCVVYLAGVYGVCSVFVLFAANLL